MLIMAREWALRGLSEEELRPDPKPEAPKTPRGKIENFWYHYKWHTIAIFAAAVILSVMIGQLVTRDNPDYMVILATQTFVPDAAKDKISSELQKYGRDIDGDGKIEVTIDSISLANDSQLGSANQMKFITHLSAVDVMFYIMDKETYDSRIAAQESGDFRVFAPINLNAEGIEGDGRYWNWKDSGLRKDEAMKGMPENLYFCVRNVSETVNKKESKRMYEQCMELLRAYLSQKPLTGNASATEPGSGSTAAG